MASLFDEDEEDSSAAEIAHELDAATPEELTPRTNPDLLGHEAVELALLGEFNAGKLPHALILAGPSGIGKATLAFRLARFLFSQGGTKDAGLFGEPPKPESLYTKPESPVFRRVASGGHADLITVEREYDDKRKRLKNDLSVDAVRRIHPFLSQTAAEGGWRVVIVDGAEYMNHSAQNALLKILEEPPKNTLLVLTTTQPGAFLPTIRSRCRLLHMEALPEKTIAALLEKMAPGIGAEDKKTLLRLSGGSIGKALQYHKDKATGLYRELAKIVATLPDLDLVAVHDLADKVSRQGADQAYETLRDILTGWCERHVVQQAKGKEGEDVFQSLSGIYTPQHFFSAREKLVKIFLDTENYNLDKKQAVLAAFLALQKPEYQGVAA